MQLGRSHEDVNLSQLSRPASARSSRQAFAEEKEGAHRAADDRGHLVGGRLSMPSDPAFDHEFDHGLDARQNRPASRSSRAGSQKGTAVMTEGAIGFDHDDTYMNGSSPYVCVCGI